MRRCLTCYVARRRRIELLRGAGLAVAFAVAWMLTVALVDRLIPLPGFVRLILAIINVGAVVMILFVPLRAMILHGFDWHAAAAQIERRDKRFSGRLETAVSQLLLPVARRGSMPLVDRIVTEADALAREQRIASLVSAWPAGHAWLIALGIAIIGAVLSQLAWFDLPILLRRQITPLAPVSAVTTTRLSVEPGDVSVSQGQSCTIQVRAQRLRTGAPHIRLIGDAGQVSSYTMTSIGDSKFAFTLNGIERDWQYDVSGGDACSETYSIRLLRRPGVTQFRVRYVFPAYMNRQPTTTVNSDGLLEGPVGTQAVIDLMCTEPVASAAIIIGDRAIPARATPQANVYQASITIAHSTPYQVRLTSPRGAHGVVPANTQIRAQPDHPPGIEWTGGIKSIRLDPFDSATFRYRISDDYGVASASVSLSKNDLPPRTFSLAPQPASGSMNLQLWDWDVELGDVMTVSISATDGRGQVGTGESIKIIAAPRSVGIDQQVCAAELDHAARLSEALSDEIAEALRASRQSTAGAGRAGRNAHLARAADLAGRVSAHVLRAIDRNTSRNLDDSLLGMLDRATACRSIASASLAAQKSPAASQRDPLPRADLNARSLRDSLRALAPAERARILRIDLLNLQALIGTNATHPALLPALQSAGHLLDEQIARLGIDPDDDRLLSLLEEKIDVGNAIIESLPPIDWPGEAKRIDAAELSQRLLFASWGEALTMDDNLGRARDLNLAAGAALTWPAAAGPFADALEALEDPNRADRMRGQLRQHAGADPELAAFEAAAIDMKSSSTQPTESPASPLTLSTTTPPPILARLDALGRFRGLPVVGEWVALLDRFARQRGISSQTSREPRDRIRAVPAIARLLDESSGTLADIIGFAVPDKPATSQPVSGQAAASGGYDEPLRIYFQLLGQGK